MLNEEIGKQFVEDFKENEVLINLMKQRFRSIKSKCCSIPYTKQVDGVPIKYSFAAAYFTLLENIENGNIDLSKLTLK